MAREPVLFFKFNSDMSRNAIELDEVYLENVELAVRVRNGFKRYAKKSPPVLDHFHMNVPKRSIYGLLGASGCGKTTILGCIAGIKRLNSGEIRVLGGSPGTPNSGIPGPRVGYMPQEIALYGDFTIAETINFFAKITNLNPEQAEENFKMLNKFLSLPSTGQFVKTLSGGQQRRVSFATALVHRPEILILDEPTVGVDAILREEIWNYLVHLTTTSDTTVIITTHYIEEARSADLVGLMRNGRLLAEESPQNLLEQHRVGTLEQVFIDLCVRQNLENEEVDVKKNEPSTERETIASCQRPILNLTHLRALVWKNFLWMWRNVPIVVFLTILPVVQLSLTFLCIGQDPVNLPISIVNYELDFNETCEIDLTCNSDRLSCSFIDKLGKFKLKLNYFENELKARNSVQEGQSWAVVIFESNYSQALRSRFGIDLPGPNATPAADVLIYQDMSNQNLGMFVKRYLFETLQEFLQDYLETCNISRKMGTLPMKFNDAIYGRNEPNFVEFAIPGSILIITFALAMGLTALSMISEKREGLLERLMVNDVTTVELCLGHFAADVVFMIFQATVVLVMSFVVFKTTVQGQVALIAVMSLLAGLCGICFGLFISIICDGEIAATYTAMGTFLPIILLSGIVWPTEGVHDFLKPIASLLPLTTSSESVRSIIQRGWGLSYQVVYTGFASLVIWIVLFLLISFVVVKFKKM